MREQRWETRSTLQYNDILSLRKRLSSMGLNPVDEEKDIICYIEEWKVREPKEIQKLDFLYIEDVTLVHIHEGWRGDFYLLAGGYHTVYRKYQTVNTYCSVSHPWMMQGPLLTHFPRSMFWVGFRHTHGFIRIRLHTREVITPGDSKDQEHRSLWLEERQRIFLNAIKLLDLPIQVEVEKEKLLLKTAEEGIAFFCSWPDAFGPCQFEYNSSDPFQFLALSSRLAATQVDEPATVRAYLTGFAPQALKDFESVDQGGEFAYRCSTHCQLKDLPQIKEIIGEKSRLYLTLCEFQTQSVFPNLEDIYSIVGMMGVEGGYKIEVRLNRVPYSKEEMADWLEKLLAYPMVYAPLPPFP